MADVPSASGIFSLAGSFGQSPQLFSKDVPQLLQKLVGKGLDPAAVHLNFAGGVTDRVVSSELVSFARFGNVTENSLSIDTATMKNVWSSIGHDRMWTDFRFLN